MIIHEDKPHSELRRSKLIFILLTFFIIIFMPDSSLSQITAAGYSYTKPDYLVLPVIYHKKARETLLHFKKK